MSNHHADNGGKNVTKMPANKLAQRARNRAIFYLFSSSFAEDNVP
jgi:hypothetical protein